jgi:hypothetical protein
LRRVQDGAAVLDRGGTVIGHVTSCISLGEHQIGLALVHKLTRPVGTALCFLNPSRGNQLSASSENLKLGDRIPQTIPGTVLTRFMPRAELPQAGEE